LAGFLTSHHRDDFRSIDGTSVNQHRMINSTEFFNKIGRMHALVAPQIWLTRGAEVGDQRQPKRAIRSARNPHRVEFGRVGRTADPKIRSTSRRPSSSVNVTPDVQDSKSPLDWGAYGGIRERHEARHLSARFMAFGSPARAGHANARTVMARMRVMENFRQGKAIKRQGIAPSGDESLSS
jgi:hypothetical protein